MATSQYAGYVGQPGRWSSSVKLGYVNTPPVEFAIDNTLPAQGQDANYPNRDWVVIPRGRIVAAKATTLTETGGKTIITLANGVDPLDAPSFATGTIPFGYAPYHLYREIPGLPADRPLGALHETIEVPYTSINESYNTSTNGGSRLITGEWLMPYYGSTSMKTAFVPRDRGKLVRWVGKKVYQDSISTPSGSVILSSASFPAFKPNVLVAYSASWAVISSGAVRVGYNETYGKWVAEFANGPADLPKVVVYEYGAAVSQRVAQAIGIEPVSTAGGINSANHDLAGWLKWVGANYGSWDWPPIMNINPVTAVTQEAVTITSNAGTLAQVPVIPFKAITVSVTGSIQNPDGTTTTVAGPMDLLDTLFFNDYTQGKYYDIDFLNGTLTFQSNVSVTTCKVDYYYETNWNNGMKYDAGQFNLTDGRDSGVYGLPPHLDVAGVVGVLRAMLLP
jgi:hypothetical protein